MSSEIGMILIQLPCHFSVLKNVFFSSFSLILPGSYDKLLQCNLGGVGEPDPLCTVNSVNESQTFPAFATFASATACPSFCTAFCSDHSHPCTPTSSLPFQHVLFPALPAVETSTEGFVCIILFVIHKVFAKLFFISVPLFVCMEYPLRSL